MKRILIPVVLLILILCMVGCSQDTPKIPVEIGTTESEIGELRKMGLIDSTGGMIHYTYYHDGDYLVVCKMKRLDNYREAYLSGEDPSNYKVVEAITRIRDFKPREDAYLRLKKGMDFVEVVKLLGFPTAPLSGPHGRYYKISDNENKLAIVYFDLDDTVVDVIVQENNEIVWQDNFDQEEAPETDVATTIITVIVSAAVVGGSIGVLLAQYRGKKKEDIEE